MKAIIYLRCLMLLFLVPCVFALVSVEDSFSPIVETRQGLVRGLKSSEGDYYSYLGIPYASVINRFRAPGVPPKWQGIMDAFWVAPACIQRGSFGGVDGSEDCLALNVYAPLQANETNPLPVMVWIHGGGFIAGSGPVGPQFIVSKDVVLVSLNYRLGAFGFLCLGVKEAKGNAGLKDQLAALRWVRENIRSFGGNPDSVTLFGESAGAASVSAHILSPASAGLFHRAITQSGTAIDSWALDRYPIERAKHIANRLGTETEDLDEIVAILTSATSEDLLSATEALSTNYNTLLPVAPCIEQEIQDVEPFLTKDPYTTLKNGNYTSVPWINGFNNQEGLWIADAIPVEGIDDLLENFLPDDLTFATDEDRRSVVARVKAFYLGEGANYNRTVQAMVDYTTDIYFLYGAKTATDLHVDVSDHPVYFYEFRYDGDRNYVKRSLSNVSHMPGACHGDDVYYLFELLASTPSISPEDGIIIDRMTTLWTNFAKYGAPSPSPTPLLPAWRSANATHANCLVVDNTMSVEQAPYASRMRFWDDIYAQYRRAFRFAVATSEGGNRQ